MKEMNKKGKRKSQKNTPYNEKSQKIKYFGMQKFSNT